MQAESRGAIRAPLSALLVFAIVPILFEAVIVATRHVRLSLATGLPGMFKIGFVTASALSHWGIYSSLLVMFGLTLRRDREPLITTMARRMHGELTPEMLRYTGQVTRVWTCFFAFQLTVSVSLFCFAPLIVWSTFVNILDLPMVAALFAAEYFCRLRLLRDPPRHSIGAILNMVANPAGDGAKPRLLPMRTAPD